MVDGWRAKESLALMLQLNTRIEMKEITLWLIYQSLIRMRMRIGWMQMWWWQPITKSRRADQVLRYMRKLINNWLDGPMCLGNKKRTRP